MSLSIPNFAERTAPLNEFLEEAYAQSGRRTKRSIRSMELRNLSWGKVHEKIFFELQDTLRNAICLSYPKEDHVICVYTDASNLYWSGVVTQIKQYSLKKPIERQCHEPLAFLGAAFRGAQLKWSMFEKEGFAIFQVFDKMDYLFFGEKATNVFKDHRNPLHVVVQSLVQCTLGGCHEH